MITLLIIHFLIGYFVNRPFYKWQNCNRHFKDEQRRNIVILVLGGIFLTAIILAVVGFDLISDFKTFKEDFKKIKEYHKQRKEDSKNSYYNDWRENLKGHKKYVEENDYITNNYRDEFK